MNARSTSRKRVGMSKRKNRQGTTIKKMFFGSLKKYCLQLEQELEQLRTNPQSTLGQVVMAARRAESSNKKLSVLAATLLKMFGGEEGKVKVEKAMMESFQNLVLNIRWELPEGITDPEKADWYYFTFDALTQEQHQAEVAKRQALEKAASKLVMTHSGAEPEKINEPVTPEPAPPAVEEAVTDSPLIA